MIGAFIILGIGCALFPQIEKQVAATGGADTLLSFVPLMFALAISFAAIMTAYSGLKSCGLIGNEEEYEDSNEEEETEEEEEPKKITSEVIKSKQKITSTIIKEEVEPIITKGKNRFEVKSKYE